MSRIQRRLSLLLSASAPLMSSCSRAPMVDIEGSYFPSWMICLAASIAFVLVLRTFLRYRGLEESIRMLVWFYPAVVVLLACVCWLILFR